MHYISNSPYKEWIRIGMRDENVSPHHWRSLPPDYDMRANRKFISIGGNGNENPSGANYMCKVHQSYLGNKSQNFDLLGIYYPNGNKDSQYVAFRALFILDEILVPQIADRDKLGNLHRLPFEDACRNMRKVVFGTHCHGGRVTRETTKLLDNTQSRLGKIMLSIGYSQKEAEIIQRQMVVFHHNNPCDDLGMLPTCSTDFYRITQADEQNRPVVYAGDSFGYYLATEKMSPHDIYCAPLSKNERALIIPQISPAKKSEHNGAYWQIPHNEKYESAQIEEYIFLALFDEVTSTDYLIESPAQIEENAMKNNLQLQKIYAEMSEDGSEFMDNYRAYRQNVHEEFNVAKEKVLNGQFSAQDGEEISQEALFFHDENGHNILDLAVKHNDAVTAGIIWHNMLSEMPLFEHGKDLKTIYQNCSYDMLETKKKHQFYTMHALDTDNEKMFSALAQNNDVLVGLDYRHAGAKTAFCAAQKFCEINWLKEKMSLGALNLVYGKSLEQLIKRCRQPDMSSAEMQNVLPQLVAKSQELTKRQIDSLCSMIQNIGAERR